MAHVTISRMVASISYRLEAEHREEGIPFLDGFLSLYSTTSMDYVFYREADLYPQ